MKILVISLAGIGDTLLATPLLRALREQRPSARIDLFARWPGARDLLAGNSDVNQVYQQELVSAGLFANLRFFAALRRERYDVSINTHPQGKRAYRLMARLVGAPLRLSHRYENHSILDRWLVNRTIDQDYNIHCVDNSLRLLPLMGLREPAQPIDCALFFSPQEKDWANQFILKHNLAARIRVAIHVGSGKTKNLKLKRWPVDHYIQLINKILEQYRNATILLFGGPDEKDENAQILAAVQNSALIPVPSRTMKEAAALLKQCQLFISVDNVFMHLAATVKVPQQIVIESPTFNKTIEPYHHPFRLVPNPMAGGRSLDYYRYDGRDIQGGTEHLLACMRSITPDAVLAEVSSALQQVGPT
jgi:heptosyltransferase-2